MYINIHRGTDPGHDQVFYLWQLLQVLGLLKELLKYGDYVELNITVTALLMLKFGLTPSIDTITYHHWWDINSGERVLDNSEGHAVKTCPGTGFFGGNSTASAKNNFYPLVSQKMQEILKSIR